MQTNNTTEGGWESEFDRRFLGDEFHMNADDRLAIGFKAFLKETLATREKELVEEVQKMKREAWRYERSGNQQYVSTFKKAMDKVLALLQPVEDQKGCCVGCSIQIEDDKPTIACEYCPCHKKEHE